MHNKAIATAVADQALSHVDICRPMHFEAIAVADPLDLHVVGIYMDPGAIWPPHGHQCWVQIAPILVCGDSRAPQAEVFECARCQHPHHR